MWDSTEAQEKSPQLSLIENWNTGQNKIKLVPRGAWMAQTVKRLPPAQVMISESWVRLPV